MSYILEALKKSDQERQRGTAPNLQTIHISAEKAPGRRPVWPYLLMSALLLNAGLLLWWLQPWQADKHDLAGEGTAGKQIVSAENQPIPVALDSRERVLDEASRGLKGSNTDPLAAKKQASTEPEPSIAALSSNQAGALAEEHPEKPAKTHDLAKAANIQPTPSDAGLTPSPPRAALKKASPTTIPQAEKTSTQEATESAKKSPLIPQGISPTPPAVFPVTTMPQIHLEPSTKADTPRKASGKAEPAPTEVKKASESTPTASQDQPIISHFADKPISSSYTENPRGRKAQSLHELPFPIQQEVPKMSFSVLIYSSKPADRMISINGQMRREGQEVVEGLKLEEITPDGAIFSFRGYMFRKGVF